MEVALPYKDVSWIIFLLPGATHSKSELIMRRIRSGRGVSKLLEDRGIVGEADPSNLVQTSQPYQRSGSIRIPKLEGLCHKRWIGEDTNGVMNQSSSKNTRRLAYLANGSTSLVILRLKVGLYNGCSVKFFPTLGRLRTDRILSAARSVLLPMPEWRRM